MPEGPMIYIYNCGKEVCSLPAKACSACSGCLSGCLDTCGEECANCCAPFQKAIEQCSSSYREFCSRPLGTYVAIAVASSCAEVAFSSLALTQQDKAYLNVQNCILEGSLGKQVGITTFLYVEIGLAVVSLFFAFYMQSQLWQRLLEEGRTNNSPFIPSERVKAHFRELLLYDLPSLFYFLLLVTQCVWSYLGSTWAQEGGACNPEGRTSWAAWFGTSIFWVAFLYSIFWYWCSCSGNVTLPVHYATVAGALREP